MDENSTLLSAFLASIEKDPSGEVITALPPVNFTVTPGTGVPVFESFTVPVIFPAWAMV
jgi:hypothetical protein